MIIVAVICSYCGEICAINPKILKKQLFEPLLKRKMDRCTKGGEDFATSLLNNWKIFSV